MRNRLIVFGGSDAGGRRNDVWVLSLSGTPAWNLLTPTGAPPSPRFGHTAIYDPVRDRMVVFGGFTAVGYGNDVWALSLSGTPTWSELTPAGTAPSARFSHAAIYDPVRARMITFGGYDGSNRNDVWELSLSGSPAWTQLLPQGTPPVGRTEHTAIYDPVRDQVLVFGGFNFNYGYLGDVWALSLEGPISWTQPNPSGTPPSSRGKHTAIYDPVRDRMVVFGGYDYSLHNDLWALSQSGSGAWSQITPAGAQPAPRAGHTAIYDPVSDRMLVFGGANGVVSFNDLWSLGFSGIATWSPIAIATNPPARRMSPTAVFDPVRDRMVVFGGYDGTYYNDVWTLSLSESPAWNQVAATGTPPLGRYGHTAIYDPVRDRILVFGGYGGSVGWLNDVWALSLSGNPAWSLLTPIGTKPVARHGHTAVYDPVRDRMVVFGGWDGGVRNDSWALSLSGSPAWGQLAPSGTAPSRRVDHTAIYDPVRDRMVVCAGWDQTAYLSDVWALSLAGGTTWSQLSPAGVAPSVRYYVTAIYDPVRDRMVTFGGWDGYMSPEPPHTPYYFNDVWALGLAGTADWTQLAPAGGPPTGRYTHTAIFDPKRDRMIVFAGYDGSLCNDAAALLWGTPLAVDQSAPSVWRLGSPRPNPSRGPTTVEFELAELSHIVLDVFDAQGRRVKRIADAWLPGGRYTRTWRGDDEHGRPVNSGVYFLRMQGKAVQDTRRLVRIR